MHWILVRLFKWMGWTSIGTFSELPKYVIIIAPHTSWMDFFIGLMMRSVHKLDANFVGKIELFKFPLGPIMRALGGYPVNRSKSHNFVNQVVKLFNDEKHFRLALAPEGTRKKVAKLKSGFYFIAQRAKVPIVMVTFDYENKEVRIKDPFWPSGNYDEDMKVILGFYSGVKGKVPARSID